MIAHLHGTVAAIAPEGAVLDIGGFGLRVLCTPCTLAALRPGERAQLSTSLAVKEDSLTLYGFATEDERNVFELLQSAKGVGASLALAILAVHSPDGLRRAVATEDLNALVKVPRIGRKGAQQIVLDLRDKLGPPGDAGDHMPGSRPASRAGGWRDQVQSGLVNLGWSAKDADQAIIALEEDGTLAADGEPVNVAVVLRAALRKLAKQ